MGSDPIPHVAVVGSGPAGCYAAQFIRKSWPAAEISIFERLPVPYGLVRYGVAPDHQGTKAVQQQFDRLFTKDGVLFTGNVDVGRDVDLAALRASFDVVILATGLSGDRPLAIRGETLEGVVGAGRVTRIVNEHPDERPNECTIGTQVVVVGNGNVAIDVVRLLIKPDGSFDGSDLDLETRRRIAPHPIQTLHVLGRSPAHRAKFDATMIAELARIPGVRFVANGLTDDEPADDPRVRTLTELVQTNGMDAALEAPGPVVTFYFGWVPDAIVGDDRVQAVVARSTTDSSANLTLEADTVITAIGFEGHPDRDLMAGDHTEQNADADAGRLGDGLYGVGWCTFGPGGNIADNRARSRATVETIVEDAASGRLPLGKPGRHSLPSGVLAEAVDYEGWKRIDEVETQTAPTTMVRRKITATSTMLEIARGGDAPPT